MWKRRCWWRCRRSIGLIETCRVFLSVKSNRNTPRPLRAEHQGESQDALTFQMSRSPRCLPQGYSFHITLRCNSRQFLIAKGLRRDVLLAVLAKAQAKVPHRLYAVCLMANHLHLLIKPEDATQPPEWSLRALSGSQVLRHCDCAERPQTSAEYAQDYPRQPQSSWSA